MKRNVNINNGQPDQDIEGQKEGQAEIYLQQEVIINMVKDSEADIAKDECYPDTIRKTARGHCFFDESHLLEKEVQILWGGLSRNFDAEKFYSSFYQSIVLNARKLSLWRGLCAHCLLLD